MAARKGIRRIQGLEGLPAELRGGVVAIGNFDGVHRGHQAVLEKAREAAGARDVPVLVLTFEPHPRAVFRPQEPLFRLTPAPLRARILGALGFDAVVEMPFDHHFAGLTADRFVSQVLLDGLGIGEVVTGFDFHFGKDRAGGPSFLMDAGDRQGFGVHLVEAFCDEGSAVVSSSRIRQTLMRGDVAEAAGMLGYRFTVAADIVRGRQLGRDLGYPTANMALDPGTGLKHGIYAVRFRRADGTLHDGVASFGRRPTVDEDGEPLLETYLFDFSGDLYGQTCEVSFFGYLRGEETFAGLDALVAQMKRDEAEARGLLSNVAPLSTLDGKLTFGAS